MAHAFGTLDELGDGYGFRKVRQALGVTAFGVNVIVMPPGHVGFHHFHDEQDELYFVHAGTARFEVDGDERVLGPGGLCHVDVDHAAEGVERRRRRPGAAGGGREGRLRRPRRPPRRRRPTSSGGPRSGRPSGRMPQGPFDQALATTGQVLERLARVLAHPAAGCRDRIASAPARARREGGTR